MTTGRDRKNSLKALFAGDIAPETERAPETKSMPAGEGPTRAASGAVKAMGLTLSSITREAEEARAGTATGSPAGGIDFVSGATSVLAGMMSPPNSALIEFLRSRLAIMCVPMRYE